MRLCTCGHRDARHDQLDGEVRGECMACSCTFFEDVRSSIEEEIPALTPGTAEHAEYVAEAASITPGLPSGIQPGDQLFVMANVPVYRVLDDSMTPGMPDPCQPIGCDNGHHLPGCFYAERDREPLESFNAWRCPRCGSRSPARNRCDAHYGCKGALMDPVRVEIHSRDAP